MPRPFPASAHTLMWRIEPSRARFSSACAIRASAAGFSARNWSSASGETMVRATARAVISASRSASLRATTQLTTTTATTTPTKATKFQSRYQRSACRSVSRGAGR